MLFRDRREAGRFLARKLTEYADRPDVLVLALPRGGVPVASEVAQALHVPFDVFLVRKLGLPGHEELAMGAIASGGVRILNDDVVRALGMPEDVIETVAAAEQQELERRERIYRGDRPPPAVRAQEFLADSRRETTCRRAACPSCRARESRTSEGRSGGAGKVARRRSLPRPWPFHQVIVRSPF